LEESRPSPHKLVEKTNIYTQNSGKPYHLLWKSEFTHKIVENLIICSQNRFIGGFWKKIWKSLCHNGNPFVAMEIPLAQWKSLWRNGNPFDTMEIPLAQWKSLWHNGNPFGAMEIPLAQWKSLWHNRNHFCLVNYEFPHLNPWINHFCLVNYEFPHLNPWIKVTGCLASLAALQPWSNTKNQWFCNVVFTDPFFNPISGYTWKRGPKRELKKR